MDIQAITALIGSLGFPIAASIAMFAMLNKEREEHNKEREEHKSEMCEVTKAIQNNTLALQALKDKLDNHG